MAGGILMTNAAKEPAQPLVKNLSPLLAGPLSGLRRPRPQPPHQITGPCEPGGIIPIGVGAYRSIVFLIPLAL